MILRFTSASGSCSPDCSTAASAIEEKPIVVDAHLGEGNVLLFANNPSIGVRR